MADETNLLAKPRVVNMTVYHLDSWKRWVFWFKDGAGNPIDLTGVEVKTEVKNSRGEIIKTLVKGAGYDLTGADNNGLVFNATVDIPATKESKEHRYDTQLTYPDGFKQTKFVGLITVLKDITDNP